MNIMNLVVISPENAYNGVFVTDHEFSRMQQLRISYASLIIVMLHAKQGRNGGQGIGAILRAG